MAQKWPFSEMIIATGNHHKKQQFQDLLGQEFGLQVKGLDDFPSFTPVEEDQDTFAGNAIKKAETLSQVTSQPVIADDSGIVVPALDGQPGIYSARYAGLHATDSDNNQKLLQEMAVLPYEQRAAYYVCVLALAIPGQRSQSVCGECHGEIINELRGTEGFGYDPLFYIPAENATMAELPAARRYQISHRAKASAKLIQLLKGRYRFS